MANDKLLNVEIESVSTKFGKDKEGDLVEKTKIVIVTDDLSTKDAGRLLQLGRSGPLEITIAPQLMAVQRTGEKSG